MTFILYKFENGYFSITTNLSIFLQTFLKTMESAGAGKSGLIAKVGENLLNKKHVMSLFGPGFQIPDKAGSGPWVGNFT